MDRYGILLSIQKLFADSANIEETVAEANLHERIRSYYERYSERLKLEAGNAYISSMAFLTEGTEPTNKICYNMVLATKSLYVLNSYKFAGQGMSHEASMLCFTDFYYFNNFPHPCHGRQSDDAFEAEVIFLKGRFRGQTVLLGAVKMFVIEDTAFPFHARALR